MNLIQHFHCFTSVTKIREHEMIENQTTLTFFIKAYIFKHTFRKTMQTLKYSILVTSRTN